MNLVYSQPSKCKIVIFFCRTLFGCFKIKFQSGFIINFLLYHCNLFVGVVIKVCLLRYILSDEFVRILYSPFLP